jgi:hypothetical protein
MLFSKRVLHEAHRAMRVELRAVARDDASRFLPAMLQRVEPEIREVRRLRMTVDTEDAAHETMCNSLARERPAQPIETKSVVARAGALTFFTASGLARMTDLVSAVGLAALEALVIFARLVSARTRGNIAARARAAIETAQAFGVRRCIFLLASRQRETAV